MNFVCVASVSVFRGNPCRETKHAFLCGKTLDANFREAHAGSADMHFTWRAWDKTHSRLALFAKLLCVASVLRQFQTNARLEIVVLCPVAWTMDVIRFWAWTLCWQHGFQTMDVTRFWAWMFCSHNALDHARHDGLGMDALPAKRFSDHGRH